jgi:acyl-coenzyme A synthetase/AMP-(fatty) acid ligase
VRVPDPVMFIGYWRNDAATRDKFRGAWLVTGDTGVADDEGFIRFVGRDDDVMTSASAASKTRLAAHEYPRIIHFVGDLPLTATGKAIRRELREYPTLAALATLRDNNVL